MIGRDNGSSKKLKDQVAAVVVVVVGEQEQVGGEGRTVRDMEQEQFDRLLQLFPVVRPRTYCADDFNGLTVQSQSLAQREDEPLLSPPPPAVPEVGVNGSSSQDTEEEKTTEAPSTLVASLSDHGSATSFWDLLRAVAQQQLEEKDAEAFCDTFKLLHEELVNKALSLDAIERIAKRWPLATK
ncbi:unnamed protein product [Sphagnum jensenii]|uniref:Uncharacterized protein n=1 Tax=Sphagnum jensenii TaxID=128206 RepID=A0ABP0VNG7_9BRYO